jgi:hypothetical protein
MGAEEAHHERLIEMAASAHRRRVAVNLARAVASLHSAARLTPMEIAEVATADAAAVAADKYKALADWRARHAR